jgi:hypothetical protein
MRERESRGFNNLEVFSEVRDSLRWEGLERLKLECDRADPIVLRYLVGGRIYFLAMTYDRFGSKSSKDLELLVVVRP